MLTKSWSEHGSLQLTLRNWKVAAAKSNEENTVFALQNTDLFWDQTCGYRQLLLVGKSGQDMKLTINLHMPRLRMCGTTVYSRI